MNFELHATAADSRARAATLVTAHGVIETPMFMPVGTRGSVRTQTLAQLEALDAPVLLANTYHLMTRPGPALFEQLGGLHRWMGWSRAILTDSGGYQMYSLAAPALLTPEESIAMQRALGSDIMMVLDRCLDARASHADARAAIDVTLAWARRSQQAAAGSAQALFAIVQGACHADLRRDSARALVDLDLDGYAIGGLAVGEPKAQREDITELTAAVLPADKPRYLMGVGTPLDILEAVHRGVDMFDCILPTAVAQHGVAFTSAGKLDLRRGVHRLADRPLDDSCACEACRRHSRSYVHHLIKSGEPLGWSLLATHNLQFYLALARAMRAHILAGTFASFYATQRELLAAPDRDNPPGPRPKQRRATPTTRGAFTLHERDGVTSIRHVAADEPAPGVDPDATARSTFVEPSARIARAAGGSQPALVVWDVGLGAGHNAMALIRELDAHPAHAPVTIVSFERDLDALHLALAHAKHFPHIRHPAPHRLARDGRFARPGLTWVLAYGDFLATFLDAPAPDVIFYDPSPVTTEPPWNLATLQAVRALLDRPVELFTASPVIRTTLVAAGFAERPPAGFAAG